MRRSDVLASILNAAAICLDHCVPKCFVVPVQARSLHRKPPDRKAMASIPLNWSRMRLFKGIFERFHCEHS